MEDEDISMIEIHEAFNYTLGKETVTRVAHKLGLQPVKRGMLVSGTDGGYDLFQIMVRLMERFERLEDQVGNGSGG